MRGKKPDDYLLPIEKDSQLLGISSNAATDANNESAKPTHTKRKSSVMAPMERCKNLPVAYINPNRALDSFKTLQANVVPLKQVGKQHEKQSAKHRIEYAIYSQMEQPLIRMQVRESPIPMHHLYNS